MLSFKVDGWILVDFPRTLGQAKALEKIFSGFSLISDGPKLEDAQNYETWSKFTDPNFESKPGYEGEIGA